MKKFLSIFSAALLAGMVAPSLLAATQISVDFFHENLESYGDWREVGDYGYCWQPRDVDANWRPYSDGHWIYTDAGWTWDSDEPYSWAVYHYGRWAQVERVGWVWVPGNEWGPAWVSWRRSPKHVGWAPLPPEARFERSSGFSRNVDVDFDIGPTSYNFVEVRNFGAPKLRTVFVEPRENVTIISQTTNITKVTYVNNVVYNEGPRYDVISRETAQPIRRLKLERREDIDGDIRSIKGDQLRGRVEGESFKVVALSVDAKPPTAPKKVVAKVQAAQIDHGWKNAGPPAEVAKLRTKVKSEAAAPVPVEAVEPAPAAKVNEGQGKKGDAAAPTAVAPAEPQSKPEPPAMPGKKGKNQRPQPSDAAPVPGATPGAIEGNPPPAEPATKPGKQPKPGKNQKPVAPDAVPAPAATPEAKPDQAADEAQPGKKGKGPKGAGQQRPPAATPGEEAAPAAPVKAGKKEKRNEADNSAPMPVQSEERKPKNSPADASHGKPAAAPTEGEQKPKQEKAPGREKPEPAAARGNEPPARSDAQPREKHADAPQPGQSEKKGKGKEEKNPEDNSKKPQ